MLDSLTTDWNSSSVASTTQGSAVRHFPQWGTPSATAVTRFLAPQLAHTMIGARGLVAVTPLPAARPRC